MKNKIYRIFALSLTVALVACSNKTSVLSKEKNLINKEYIISETTYPKMSKYPIQSKNNNFGDEKFDKVYEVWKEDLAKQRKQDFDYKTGMNNFFEKSIPIYLHNSKGKNKVYSPLNVYMALSMLAEITDKNSRSQVMSLLGEKDIDFLRKRATAIWNAHYLNDGVSSSVLANSIWLNKNIEFDKKSLNGLSKNYKTSSYSGEMGTNEFNVALHSWINKQTGSLLEKQVGNLEFSKETIMALVSTIYFKDKWENEFLKANTVKGLFDAENTKQKCEYMKKSGRGNYYYSDKFSAISKKFQANSKMWFILPDKKVSVDELIKDEKTIDFIVLNGKDFDNKFVRINRTIPKFDIVSTLNLVDGLKFLGIKDVFDVSKSDFSPILKKYEDIFLDKVEHSARVKIDEEGCEAAAYTVMMMMGTSMPPKEEIDFKLDRPFIFAITGHDGLVLFVGIVNKVK